MITFTVDAKQLRGFIFEFMELLPDGRCKVRLVSHPKIKAPERYVLSRWPMGEKMRYPSSPGILKDELVGAIYIFESRVLKPIGEDMADIGSANFRITGEYKDDFLVREVKSSRMYSFPKGILSFDKTYTFEKILEVFGQCGMETKTPEAIETLRELLDGTT